MIYWTGICWVCTRCGSAFDIKCPICGATPENTEHDTICCCGKCIEKRWEGLECAERGQTK